MKKTYLILICLISSIITFAQQKDNKHAEPAKTDTLPHIKFDKLIHDFGKIKEGTLATYSFVFYNTGTTILVLNNVQASCGCTTPEWSREPIMPGGKGIIKAVYNSYGRPGDFTKYITVKSNAGADISLTIKGAVLTVIPDPVSPVRNPQAE